MNRLKQEKQVQIISALVEGNSIRATSRMTGTAKGTVLKLLADVGEVCSDYQNKMFRNLSCKRLQCDEIWSFCYAKEKNVPENKKGHFGYGDIYTWTALCEDTKLIPTWYVGKRDMRSATVFMNDLANRLNSRVQITTDGLRAYLEAVENAFGGNVDFSQLVKLYGNEKEKEKEKKEARYSASQCIGTRKSIVTGSPKSTSTSYVERQNLTMRMSMRRFTRLTNGFSKKIENLEHAVALHFMYYNFCRIHQSLRVTPAMKARVTRTLWEIEDILNLLDSN
jgi:IS1 family transposase